LCSIVVSNEVIISHQSSIIDENKTTVPEFGVSLDSGRGSGWVTIARRRRMVSMSE
jgi:hypothetical protein